MSGRRSLRYHQMRESDDEFETPAFQIAAEQLPAPRPDLDESDDDLQSESGLGESPEEDLIEEQPSDDDNAKVSHPEDDDSDSDPEDLPRESTNEREKKRMEAIRGVILQEKERRRNLDDLFKLQKKEKLAALNKRKLPEELLKELPQQSEKKQKTDQDKPDAKEDEKTPSSEEEEDEDLDSDEEDDDESEEEDFMSLGDTQGVSLVSKAHKSQGSYADQPVADFKRAMLYGGRHKRITSQQARLQKAKRMAKR